MSCGISSVTLEEYDDFVVEAELDDEGYLSFFKSVRDTETPGCTRFHCVDRITLGPEGVRALCALLEVSK